MLGPCRDEDIGPSMSRIPYACIARGGEIVVEHRQDAEGSELSAMASAYVQGMPLHHKAFSIARGGARFICLMEGPFLFCAFFHESVSKAMASSFLKLLMSEFMRHAWVGGSASLPTFSPLLRHLVTSFAGMAMEGEEDREEWFSVEMSEEPSETGENGGPYIAWLGKSRQDREKARGQAQEVKDIMMGNKGEVIGRGLHSLEVVLDIGYAEPQGMSIYAIQEQQQQRQIALRLWRRSLYRIILFDAVACAILLAIWLGICNGVRCIKS